MKSVRLSFALLALLPVLVLSPVLAQGQLHDPSRAAARASGSARVGIISSDEKGLSLEVRGLTASVVPADSAARVITNALGHEAWTPPGELPRLAFTVGVPYDATDFTISVDPLSVDTVTLRQGVYAFGGSRASAPSQASVAEVSIERGLRVVRIFFRPVTAFGDRLTVLRDTRLRLVWRRQAAPVKSGGDPVAQPEIPTVEEIMRTSILNYDEARQWRRDPAPQRTLAGASGWGMEEGLVLLVPGDGAVRAGGGELRSASRGSFSAPLVSDLRLRNRADYRRFNVVDRNSNGRLDDDDYLEFAAERNNSFEPGFYFDTITDTNAYVLSWHGGTGALPSLSVADGRGAAPPLTGAFQTVHIESDTVYFSGVSYPGSAGDIFTVHVSERVEMEGYKWRRINYPNRQFAEFVCHPDYPNLIATSLAFQVARSSNSDHNLEITLNGNVLGTWSLPGLGDTLLQMTVPSGFLINGRNELIFTPRPPPGLPPDSIWSTYDEIYIDYLEIGGRIAPASDGGPARIVVPGGGSLPVRVAVSGFQTPPDVAISPTHRVALDSVRKGFLFRLSSRLFAPGLRGNPGFVAFGDKDAFYSNVEGIMMIEVDGATGRITRQGKFATYQSAGEFDKALTFLNEVRSGNILVAGFSTGAGSSSLPAALRDAFVALGATRISGNDLFLSAWAFTVRKGQPSTAVERFEVSGWNDAGITLDAFIPDEVNGTKYQAMVTLPEAGEYQIASFQTPRIRYHAADSLLATANAADLIIITHPLFRAESEELAEHRRRHDSLRVRVVDVETVYDEFNHGIKSPLAIRQFIHYADTNWRRPAPMFVLLFGDASLDPQQRVATSRSVDYIPSNGLPPTDYLYTVAPNDTTMRWRQFIGRLPASVPADARAMVDKLIAYDAAPPAAWNKHAIFLAGGTAPDELDRHRRDDQKLADNYILSYTFQGDTTLIFRTSPDLSFGDDRDGPWAHAAMNKGALWASFSGHGASKVYDLDFGYPYQVDNAGRNFILSTYSCLTGAFADPDGPARNEQWLIYPVTGAVAATGGTSYSYSNLDVAYKERLYESITINLKRVLGDVFTSAKFDGIFAGYEQVWKFSIPGQQARNTLVMYNLLGDPSMKIAVRNSVELGFSDLSVARPSGGVPLPGDTVALVRARIWNYGKVLLSTDSSVLLRCTITDRNHNELSDTVRVEALGRFRDIVFTMPLNREPGEYTLRLEADPARAFTDETYRADNDTAIQLRVRGNQPLPIEPLRYGRVVSYDDIMIRLLNPPSGPGAEIIVDTSSAFNPASSFSNSDIGTTSNDELTTTWRFSVPAALRSARTYWYRAVATSGDTSVANLFPLIESFTIDPGAGEYMVRGTGQMSETTIRELVNGPDGVGPGQRQVPIEVMSIGEADFQGKKIKAVIGREDYFTIAFDGLNVLIFPADDDVPIARGAFAFYRQSQGSFHDIDEFLEMIDSVKPGQRVVLAASGPSFYWPDSAAAIKARMRSVGASDMVDSLVDRVDSYVLIGGKGIPKNLIVEGRNNASLSPGSRSPYPVVLRSTLTVIPKAGDIATTTVGPATAWHRVAADGVGLDRISGSLFGVRRDGSRDSLFTVVGLATPIELSGRVDVAIYPRLEFRASFPADTTIRLRSIAIDFVPSPELAIVPSTLRFSADSVLQGDPVDLRGTVVNLSRRTAADPVDLRLRLLGGVEPKNIDSVRLAAIPPLDSLRHTFHLSTGSLQQVASFELEVNREDRPSEPYRQNNTMKTPLRIGKDGATPRVTIYADGQQLMPGDYVAPGAAFEVRIYDNSKLPLDSSMTIKRVIFDNDILEAGSKGTRFAEVDQGEHRASFYYQPLEKLPNGSHEIKVFVVDASGNPDTTDFMEFFVDQDLRLRNIVNWPNPFDKATTFTFMLSGSQQPVSGDISIFTLSGRKIKTITLGGGELLLGFNHIDWDGRDDDGDRIANGVYFYRVRVNDGNQSLEAIEKLVVLR